ncbi:MAG TPA: SDR family oxidoreductase [Tepidisphaeraceae bacterium]|jgi:NAD(P)-dependent dehydrogenase (short-subunit alcohol dehydrogenase family)
MTSPVALITGASRGIGRATTLALAKLDYRLALVARDESALRETARLTGLADSETLVLPGDITDADQVHAQVERTVKRFGRLDAVINVAGLAPARPIEQMSIGDWHAVLDTNLSAAFYLTRYAWPHLKRPAGGESQSVIVNISSLAGRDPFPGFAAYGAAKAALNVFSLVAAREGQADNIAVHTIAPGAVETAMFRGLLTPAQYPTERTLAPEDVADVICQCVMGRLRHTSGEVIYLHKTL